MGISYLKAQERNRLVRVKAAEAANAILVAAAKLDSNMVVREMANESFEALVEYDGVQYRMMLVVA